MLKALCIILDIHDNNEERTFKLSNDKTLTCHQMYTLEYPPCDSRRKNGQLPFKCLQAAFIFKVGDKIWVAEKDYCMGPASIAKFADISKNELVEIMNNHKKRKR